MALYTQTDCGSCSVDPKIHHPAKRSLAMCEHTGRVLRDFIVDIHRDICREHRLIGRRNCLMIEAANSLSATASPKLSITCSFALGHGRTRLGSGLRAVASRCLSRENAGRTMTVLHHALCGHDFHQTQISTIFRGKRPKFFFLVVLWATQLR